MLTQSLAYGIHMFYWCETDSALLMGLLSVAHMWDTQKVKKSYVLH